MKKVFFPIIDQFEGKNGQITLFSKICSNIPLFVKYFGEYHYFKTRVLHKTWVHGHRVLLMNFHGGTLWCGFWEFKMPRGTQVYKTWVMCKQNSIYITQVLLQQNPNASATHFHSHSSSPSPTQTLPSLIGNQCSVWINPPSQTCRSLETHTRPKSPIKNQNQTQLIRINTRLILTLTISSKNRRSESLDSYWISNQRVQNPSLLFWIIFVWF